MAQKIFTGRIFAAFYMNGIKSYRIQSRDVVLFFVKISYNVPERYSACFHCKLVAQMWVSTLFQMPILVCAYHFEVLIFALHTDDSPRMDLKGSGDIRNNRQTKSSLAVANIYMCCIFKVVVLYFLMLLIQFRALTNASIHGVTSSFWWADG